MASNPEIMEKLVMQPASSFYRPIRTTYNRQGYTIEYSLALTRTGRNHYHTKTLIPLGQRMSTAGEELAIQLGMEKAGRDPRQEAAFNDLFARNASHLHARQWTETGLMVPKGYRADRFETDSQGRRYWPRIVLIGDTEIGEILVPEGNGRVVVEWDEVFGIPRVTENMDWPHNPYTTHFWFNPTPRKDNGSDHYDVGVVRRGSWHHGGDEKCLGVGSNSGRWSAYSVGGFRPVRGLLPEIEKEIITV
ncbi:MAG: hypothetical protein HY051_06355 [Candidatus Aenigmarchaeota archaeon]|nr:hypothetical protein [Candidatus Aenigmarchaeota archaeon]